MEILRFTTAGSVDDGKSTLIGRLLWETQCVYDDQVAEAKRATSNASVEGEELDFSLLTDGLRAEREQGITIDVAYRYFSTPRRKFIIADTPGHEQYTRNMATGASTANLALILVDARNGVLEQSRRHAFIASLLGIKHMVVCVNKLDLVDYSESVYEQIKQAFSGFATRLEVPDLRFLPISALRGDNVARRSANMPWYTGPTLLELLESVEFGADRNLIDLRFPVQLVLRPDQDFRGYAGRVAGGILRKGDEVVVLPSGHRSRVARIVTHDGDLDEAFPPQSVTVCLEDELDVGRGDVLVRPGNVPHVARRFEAMIVWMTAAPLREGGEYLLKHSTQTLRARVERIRYRIDVNTLSRDKEPGALELNEIGRVVLSTQRPLVFDSYKRNRSTGGLILIDPETNGTSGAGMILQRRSAQPLPVAGATPGSSAEGWPPTVWLTGLSGSGKSTIARALERKLVAEGRAVSVLDGDVIRAGLCQDLGFSPEDRRENVRRVAEAAKLLNDAGVVVVCALISPYREVRQLAREVVGAERFVEVHVSTPLEACRERDPKGLYARADRGEIEQFTGVSAPYEAPEEPAVSVDTSQVSVEEAVASVWKAVRARA